MKLPALVLIAPLMTLPAVAAQGPEQRHEIIEWRQTLAMIDDADSLQEIERATKTVADAERDNPILEMRLGLVWARLAALKGDDRRLTNAARTFNGIVERHPDWPMAWTALAEAELADAVGPGSSGFGLRRMMGMDPEKGIIRNFVRGTGADSSDIDGLYRLTRRAVEQGEQLERSIAIRTLRSLPRRVILGEAGMAVLAARAEATFGDKDSAAAIIEIAALRHPRDPMVLRTQARMRFLVGRTDGPPPWYLGLSIADSAALARYVRDLELVVPDSILGLLPAASGDERSEIIRRFWADQDPDGLPSHDDRLAEHYRRVDFARHNYVRRTIQDSVPRFDPDTMPISSFDARGEMLLRHGSPEVRTSIGNHGGPDVTVTLKLIGMPPNESWVYRDHAGNERFYHFVRRGKARDFESVPSVLDILGESEQFKRFRPGQQAMVAGDTSRRSVLVHGGELVSIIAQELLASRQELSPMYAEMINAGYAAADSMQQLEREIGDSALRIPYSYELGFELDMNGAIDILAVGSDRAGPILQVAFAISAADLTPRQMPRGVMYPVRMRIAVRDAAGSTVVSVDTVRAFLSPTRLTPSQHLVGQLPIRIQPGEYRVRVSLESDRRGMLSQPVRVRVPSLTGRLTLSDVSIGSRSVPILWRSPTADTAWANPLGRYRNTEQLQLYFEVGGLEPETRYRTNIAIDRAEGLNGRCEVRGDVLTLSFQGEHPGRVAREQRTLALNRLRPDNYMMAVTVATDDGQSETRCRQFTVTRE